MSKKNIIFIVVGFCLIFVVAISAGLFTPTQSKLDLNNANPNIAYAQVCDIVSNPSKYDEKEIKIKGYFQKAGNNAQILVRDANQCCYQTIPIESADLNITPNKLVVLRGILKNKSNRIYLTNVSY